MMMMIFYLCRSEGHRGKGCQCRAELGLAELLQKVHTQPGQEGSQLRHSAGRERARRLKLTPIQEKAGDLKRDGHKHNTHTHIYTGITQSANTRHSNHRLVHFTHTHISFKIK